MKSSDELIQEISDYIERQKAKEKRFAYYPSLEMTREIAGVVELHFKSLGYVTEFRRCAQCNNKYDVSLEWTL